MKTRIEMIIGGQDAVIKERDGGINLIQRLNLEEAEEVAATPAGGAGGEEAEDDV